MALILLYTSLLGYGFLFINIFNVTLDFANPLNYLFIVLTILISIVLSSLHIVLATTLVVVFRKNKGYEDVFNQHFAKSLLRMVNHIFRVKVKVTGYENVPDNNNFVLISNHQDNFDIMVYLPVFRDLPVCFIAKEALFKLPVLGKYIEMLGNVPIGKFADRAAAEAIVNGIKRVKAGYPMAIFPEGKRSFGNELIDFKPGAFKLAIKPKADILVGVLYNTHIVPKTPLWKRKKIYVHFLPLIKYEDYQHMKSQELSENVKGLIQTQLNEFKKALN